jgi:transcriptional regulator with XRE-family HTH domain
MRLGAVLRAVRIRQLLRQQDVASRAGVSRATVARAENGHVRTLTVGTLIDLAGALSVRLDLEPQWRGGNLGRTLNSGHSAMHEQVAARFARLAEWLAQPEVSFSIYGERGVIDVLAFHPGTRALLVVELKTELVDVNALLGTVDRYSRLARRVAADRGWRASTVSCWVILRDTMTNRRRVEAYVHVLRAALPADGHEMRAWLRDPASSSVRALSFLSDAHRGSTSGARAGVRRVRAPLATQSTLNGG